MRVLSCPCGIAYGVDSGNEVHLAAKFYCGFVLACDFWLNPGVFYFCVLQLVCGLVRG